MLYFLRSTWGTITRSFIVFKLYVYYTVMHFGFLLTQRRVINIFVVVVPSEKRHKSCIHVTYHLPDLL